VTPVHGQTEHSPPRPRRGGGVYVHIPFCGSICAYCHFTRTADHNRTQRDQYLKILSREFKLRQAACSGERMRESTLSSLYVGGGTPSIMDAGALMEVLSEITQAITPQPDMEFTVEANPESFTLDVARAWRRGGVNRISLGVQSLDADVLRHLGRAATPTRSREALALACEHFPRVSADWILGPGVDSNRLAAELQEARDLGVGHISFYILEINKGTRLARRIDAGQVSLDSDAVVEQRYLEGVSALTDLGYRQYEISNFADPGQQSRHNSAYWRHQPYLGLGQGAHGYWGRYRYGNHQDPQAYIQAVERGRLPVEFEDHLDAADLHLESLFLPLRTATGVPRHRVPLNKEELDRGVKDGYWRLMDDRLALTARGFLHIDAFEELWARRLHFDTAG
jgi:putative oxygen-independent coproporphyrinogen III oxidase